jgi:hypothetical protein
MKFKKGDFVRSKLDLSERGFVVRIGKIVWVKIYIKARNAYIQCGDYSHNWKLLKRGELMKND